MILIIDVINDLDQTEWGLQSLFRNEPDHHRSGGMLQIIEHFFLYECRILQHLFIEMLICQLCIWDHKRGNLARVVYPLGDSYF